MREEDVSAQQPEAEEEARLPTPDAHPRRPSGDSQPPVEGPRPPLGLIWRVRDRASFRALARGRRLRRGVLVVTSVRVARASDPPQVAYSVDRRVGGAVVRNRVRRQLRSATHALAAELEGGRAYLVSARPEAASSTYREIEGTLRAILGEQRGAR